MRLIINCTLDIKSRLEGRSLCEEANVGLNPRNVKREPLTGTLISRSGALPLEYKQHHTHTHCIFRLTLPAEVPAHLVYLVPRTRVSVLFRSTMDRWQPDRSRHKRTFTEMSHSATLSPSPLNFGGPSASNFFHDCEPSAPSNNFLERRRTSHPHNNSLRGASTDMAEASHAERPRLEHRQSQTIIDLTDDDGPPVPRNNRTGNRASRPPQLGRSDTVSLRDLVDLTAEDEEVMITGARQLPPPPPSRVRPAPQRAASPPLFVQDRPQAERPPPNRPLHAHHIHRVYASPNAIGFFTGAINDLGNAAHDLFRQRIFNDANFHMLAHDQVMPGALNYQHAAFAERKPDHVAPPAVSEGFTRSPTDVDVVVCPSCEEELIHHKDVEGPAVKKGGKAPSRKDMEEHPFWVVKECGHVYCNRCYQFRQQAAKHRPDVNFPEVEKANSKKTKILTCNVDDCSSDVKSKDKWVGVFL